MKKTDLQKRVEQSKKHLTKIKQVLDARKKKYKKNYLSDFELNIVILNNQITLMKTLDSMTQGTDLAKLTLKQQRTKTF